MSRPESEGMKTDTSQEIIGLIPAAGWATRLAPLPCSKELFPIAFHSGENDHDGSLRPKVVCHFLLENMRLAGISKAYLVLREGKWDIPAYLGDGSVLDMSLAYLMMRLPYGAPYTLDQAYPFVRHARVALGFPDVLFQPGDAFVHLLKRQSETAADVVLGLFPTDQFHRSDMVETDGSGQVRRIEIKPQQTQLSYCWMVAVWAPTFTEFMHEFLARDAQARLATGRDEAPGSQQREIFVGDVIESAIAVGVSVQSVSFSDGNCVDIGTPAGLVRAARMYLAPGMA